PVEWKCLIGNARRWKSGVLEQRIEAGPGTMILRAERLEGDGPGKRVRFEWTPAGMDFGQILEWFGHTPLPPYITREEEPGDRQRYQTVFARYEGSVAAPTAGLHFTPELMERMEAMGIRQARVVLHVSPGTFRPVSTPTILDHVMHTETIRIGKKLISDLAENTGVQVTAVGTTTVRTLESLYWHGVKILSVPGYGEAVDIRQWDPYYSGLPQNISLSQSLEAVLGHMERWGTDAIEGKTQLIIIPGYRFRIPRMMITNFHMPGSTLLLLVAAFIGDGWRDVYDFALQNGFRFLSYGDSCLFTGMNHV
ncbi:MAG: S-adenosylmethionine:tRNA ribosyltransferase-isomerase, partial [Bacteroidales bacterium]|nr:S-adenosylmethionine:tRNA ribosyltransferase-isomerase [Bacteroidales bacterium]